MEKRVDRVNEVNFDNFGTPMKVIIYIITERIIISCVVGILLNAILTKFIK